MPFFKHEKYQILTSELHHSLKSFDEKLYICETCNKHLYKDEIPCQAVYNKMALDPIHDELKSVERLNFIKLREALATFP